MPKQISGEFDVRREAELAVERLVQEYKIDRSAIQVAAAGDDNTAGTVASGADRDRETGEPGASPTHGRIRRLGDGGRCGGRQGAGGAAPGPRRLGLCGGEPAWLLPAAGLRHHRRPLHHRSAPAVTTVPASIATTYQPGATPHSGSAARRRRRAARAARTPTASEIAPATAEPPRGRDHPQRVLGGEGDRSFGDEGDAEHAGGRAGLALLLGETVAEQEGRQRRCRAAASCRRPSPPPSGRRPGWRAGRRRRHRPPCSPARPCRRPSSRRAAGPAPRRSSACMPLSQPVSAVQQRR